MLYYFINKYKPNRQPVFKLCLKVLLSVPNGLTKEVEYFCFFRGVIVVVNTELSLYLDPSTLKSRVYPIR